MVAKYSIILKIGYRRLQTCLLSLNLRIATPN